ncbi:hypothetical protein BBJ29_006296 [Phytophthora kernoviae]|uniref:BACK domain-containing protein n=1 Tax=Phytophthora kernoviae TaxID=325452 RepID=A0A3F2RZF1_9STRA|nr:hypothetical protein BBJ29_006296 [Phytophthora kernoviae]RLN67242.1 hypothetical protein BBP00_00001735 [Phytophthora kernoviae]
MAGGVNANANGGSVRRTNDANRNGVHAVENRGRRRSGSAQQGDDSSEDIERETEEDEDDSEEEETQIPIDEQTQDFQQMTQDFPVATATAIATRDTSTMRESKQRDVELHGIEPAVVEKMLLFMYTGDVVLDLESVLGLLIAAEMYELVALGEMCNGFVLKNADDVFCDPQIVQLPEKILLELIPQDELQIRELALMEALVMWGESRVASEDKPLGELLAEMMEFVRFPTMSVSDLYGKVRPLVSDGVIKEHLLTEALFNHLKWGSQTGVSAKRAKPRALTASLRKRKRVSFTQHVSFEPTTT